MIMTVIQIFFLLLIVYYSAILSIKMYYKNAISALIVFMWSIGVVGLISVLFIL